MRGMPKNIFTYQDLVNCLSSGGDLAEYAADLIEANVYLGNSYIFNRWGVSDEVVGAAFDEYSVSGLYNIVFRGDSQTSLAGQGQYVLQTLEKAALNSIRSECSTIATVGLSVIPSMLPNAATEIDPKFSSIYQNNICMIWGGTNDLADGTSAADLYTAIQTFCAGRRAAGFKVIVANVLPRQNNPAEGYEAERLAYNASVRESWASFADEFVDVGAHPDLQDPTNTIYYYDLCHLTEIGGSKAADYASAALIRLINS